MKARLAKKILNTPSSYWIDKYLNGDRRTQKAIEKYSKKKKYASNNHPRPNSIVGIPQLQGD